MQQAGGAAGDVAEGGGLLGPEALSPVPVPHPQDANLPAAVDGREFLDPGHRAARLGAPGRPGRRTRRLHRGVGQGEHFAHGGGEVRQGFVGCLGGGYRHADPAHYLIGIVASPEQPPVDEALEPRARRRQASGNHGGQQRRIHSPARPGSGYGQRPGVGGEAERGQRQ